MITIEIAKQFVDKKTGKLGETKFFSLEPENGGQWDGFAFGIKKARLLRDAIRQDPEAFMAKLDAYCDGVESPAKPERAPIPVAVPDPTPEPVPTPVVKAEPPAKRVRKAVAKLAKVDPLPPPAKEPIPTAQAAPSESALAIYEFKGNLHTVYTDRVEIVSLKTGSVSTVRDSLVVA